VKPGRARRLARRKQMERERLERRRAIVAAKEKALMEHGDAIDAEQFAKGVTPNEMVRRRVAALLWTKKLLSGGESNETFIVMNQTRILRGLPPLEHREATERRPERGEREVRPRTEGRPTRGPARGT
jgi:hypothetical protein